MMNNFPPKTILYGEFLRREAYYKSEWFRRTKVINESGTGFVSDTPARPHIIITDDPIGFKYE